MRVIIFDDAAVRQELLPLTYTRPVGALRVGMDTMAVRWQAFVPGNYYWQTEPYLAELFPEALQDSDDGDTLYIAGHTVADAALARAVTELEPGQSLYSGDSLIAFRKGDGPESRLQYDGQVLMLRKVYDIFLLNGKVTAMDFERLTAGRTSEPLHSSNTLIGPASALFIEEGATVLASTLNTTAGPIYIGRDATVMEGCRLRGPLAMCEHSQANMGTLIYSDTTLGPYCKVGGELNNVVMQGYANKAHDGFLGNAVIGEWCNLGAGTVASNLKNDYSEIKLWNYASGRFLRTGLQFCGLIMGDHSKSAINTSFNTATTVGVGCNIVSEGMPRVFIPSFMKGGTAGFDNVNLGEFFIIAARVMARRGITLDDSYKRMYQAVFDYADKYK